MILVVLKYIKNGMNVVEAAIIRFGGGALWPTHRRRARVAAGGAHDGEALGVALLPFNEVLEKVTKELKGNVLEREGRAVEELHRPAVARLDLRRAMVRARARGLGHVWWCSLARLLSSVSMFVTHCFIVTNAVAEMHTAASRLACNVPRGSLPGHGRRCMSG